MFDTDIQVRRSATVAELKGAVELVFSHMPQNGPGKISWLVHLIILPFNFKNEIDYSYLLLDPIMIFFIYQCWATTMDHILMIC